MSGIHSAFAYFLKKEKGAGKRAAVPGIKAIFEA